MGAAKLFGLNSLALGLGQPTVPGPFGPVGGAGAEGRRGIKRWVQEGPSVQPLITAAPPPTEPATTPPPPPEPGASPVSTGGGQEHLALRSRAGSGASRWAGRRRASPPRFWAQHRRPSCRGSSEREVGGEGARKDTAGGPRRGRAGAPCREPIVGRRAESEPQTPGSVGPVTGPPLPFSGHEACVSSQKVLGGRPEAQLAGEGSLALSTQASTLTWGRPRRASGRVCHPRGVLAPGTAARWAGGRPTPAPAFCRVRPAGDSEEPGLQGGTAALT